MKIAIATAVHDVRDPRITLKIAAGLQRRAYTVYLIGGLNDSHSRQELPYHKDLSNVTWYQLTSASFSYPLRLKRQHEIWSKLNLIKPDLVIIPDPELIPLGMAWKKAMGGHVIIDIHEDTTDPHYPKNKILYSLIKMGFKYLDGAIFAFELARRPAHPIPGIPYTEAYNFYPFKLYNPEHFKTESSELTLIYSGVMGEERGTGKFIPLVEVINQLGKKCRGILAGRCYQPEHWQLLKKQTEQSEFKDRILVEGGTHFISWFRIQNLMEEADLGYLLYPSDGLHHELPSKIYEYSAHHIPILCSEIPSFKKFTGKYNTGRCFAGQPLPLLAKKIIDYWEALNEGQLEPKFQQFNELNNWDNELSKIEHLIQRVVD